MGYGPKMAGGVTMSSRPPSASFKKRDYHTFLSVITPFFVIFFSSFESCVPDTQDLNYQCPDSQDLIYQCQILKT